MTPALLSTSSSPTDEIHDEPDHDFYQDSPWFPLFVFLPIVVVIELSGYAFFIALSGRSIFEDVLDLGLLLIWVIFFGICSGVSYILLALMLEHYKGPAPASSSRLLFASRIRTILIVVLVLLITIAGSLSCLTSKDPLIFFWVFFGWIPLLGYPVAYVMVRVLSVARKMIS